MTHDFPSSLTGLEMRILDGVFSVEMLTIQEQQITEYYGQRENLNIEMYNTEKKMKTGYICVSTTKRLEEEIG